MWSYVYSKTKVVWVWLALCRQTRQIVGCALGDRSEDTARRLWKSIPASYRKGTHVSDRWPAYASVLPSTRYSSCDKQSGQTAHIERWNNTLRQRIGRFVRKTLSFSKSDAMHEGCLKDFILSYNTSRLPAIRI